jgi:thiol-disulfide isomerase/thioredoxin
LRALIPPIVGFFLPVAAVSAPQVRTVESVVPNDYRSRVVSPHRGRVLAVNFWATWCEPCREEMPDLIAAARELSPQGLDVVLVSADAASAMDSVLRFLREFRVPFRCFREDAGDPQTFIDTVDRKWEGELPHTAVYSREGVLRLSLSSRQSRKQFESAFRDALSALSPRASKSAETPAPRAE